MSAFLCNKFTIMKLNEELVCVLAPRSKEEKTQYNHLLHPSVNSVEGLEKKLYKLTRHIITAIQYRYNQHQTNPYLSCHYNAYVCESRHDESVPITLLETSRGEQRLLEAHYAASTSNNKRRDQQQHHHSRCGLNRLQAPSYTPPPTTRVKCSHS